MNDTVYYCVEVGLSALIVASASFYEYYFSKEILKKNPNCSYDEIVKAHHPLTKIMALFGIPGYEIACNRFSHDNTSNPSHDVDITDCLD